MNALEKREKFDMFDQTNFSQEKILPLFLNAPFFPPFFKGGQGGLERNMDTRCSFSKEIPPFL
ncbi:MAG: hypothetical protein JETT_1573 [Candidatus Jettenia ecosi]|uniref:Uncharacterized protein n=1 Tax=Candidatus Jettenia ecosi TaxID=2494326 RepID=A0A533QBS9_9BACT|nr:MAG: hypothetical protein JETT_1573 [Candidatus Jettenia ecosi]